MKKQMVPISLLVVAVLLLVMAAGCVVPTPVTVVETVEVEKIVTVEVEVAAEAEEAAPNPYRPDDLFQAVEDLKAATEGMPPPDGAKSVLLTNAVAPFWTAAQIGAARSSAETNVPITCQAPTAADKLAQHLSLLETFVNN